MNIKKQLEKYINQNLEFEKISYQGEMLRSKACFTKSEALCDFETSDINSFIEENKDDTFQTKLFNIIDKKELKDSDVYNKVNIDRRLFSKIRSNKDYHPSKETIILLGLALELSEQEIEELLRSASYSLPTNTTYDLIIRFCFKEKIYDVNKINEFLYDYNCKLLNE